MNYIIHELRNLESVRKRVVYNGTLRGAKSKATRDQVWADTALKITDTEGRTISTKRGNQWADHEDYEYA